MKININHIAKLANLPLNENEINKFEKQLEETLEYIENLQEVNTQNIEPTNQVTGLTNIYRNDEVEASLSPEEALSNSKSTHDGFFKVNAILEE